MTTVYTNVTVIRPRLPREEAYTLTVHYQGRNMWSLRLCFQNNIPPQARIYETLNLPPGIYIWPGDVFNGQV